MPGPLEGIKVIDFGVATVGPTATTLTAHLGADVIKVEPLQGDLCRLFEGSTDSRAFFANSNTKRSIVLNLKDDDDRNIALELAAKADIIVENFRTSDVMDRLGVGYDVVSKINPRIIFLSASAYGNKGPWKGMGSTDHYAQAASGNASITGARGGKGELLRGASCSTTITPLMSTPLPSWWLSMRGNGRAAARRYIRRSGNQVSLFRPRV